jgi:hypothetical protein
MISGGKRAAPIPNRNRLLAVPIDPNRIFCVQILCTVWYTVFGSENFFVPFEESNLCGIILENLEKTIAPSDSP